MVEKMAIPLPDYLQAIVDAKTEALRADLEAVVVALDGVLRWTTAAMDSEVPGITKYVAIVQEGSKALARPGVRKVLEEAKK